jgi:amino acid transporter
MTDVPEGAQTGGTSKLFVRQSSGLVRDVSVTNALFFNVAAFVGVGLTLYPAFYSLAFVPVWKFAGVSEYAWAAIVSGFFFVILSLIFASLTSVMPRSGGDYVFTTRIIGPFLGWLESWTLVIASIAIMAFEIPLVLRNLQITGRIIGIGHGGHFWNNANNWFTDSSGSITSTEGFLWSLVVLAVITGIVLLPTRRFHLVVTVLAGIGVASFVLMFIFGLLATNRADFAHNLPQYTGGVTSAKIAASGSAILPGTSHNFLSDLFSTTVFPFMLGIVFLQFIGYQYSAYISGEVRGNVKRGVMFALLGALAIGVLVNSLYVDAISNHLGFATNVSWGYTYWGGTSQPLPLGQPPSMPLLAVIANHGLWPLWALISFAGAIFPLLLCPVYINFISRMGLAWSLDRQLPEWFGEVNERMRAPLNAILATVGVTALFLLLQNYALLPHSIAPPEGKLNLVATLWFSIFMAALTWIMPGVNALLVRWRRPDLIANAPFKNALPWLGAVWLLFPAWIYWWAGIKPIWTNVTGSGSGTGLNYLNNSGITGTLVFVAIGIGIYVIMKVVNRSSGVDSKMLFAEIPPD